MISSYFTKQESKNLWQARLLANVSTEKKTIALVICVFLTTFSNQLFSEGWYAQTSCTCSDPLGLNPSFTASGWFRQPLNTVIAHAARGFIYVEVSKSQFDELLQQPGGEMLEEITVDRAKAKSLHAILTNVVSDSSLPVVTSGIFALIQTFLLSAPKAIIIDSFFRYVQSQNDIRAAKAIALREVVEDGGKLSRVVAVQNVEAQERLLHLYQYSITIGNVERHYILSSCQYAVKVVFREFETLGPMNNKILRSQGNDHWRIYDITDQKYEGNLLAETNRDEEYLYFRDNVDAGAYPQRISVHGGPWQHYSSNLWRTLYAKTVPR